ncbi:MAG: hypothetical protein ACREFD_18455 [Stellaceae bacterium]
MMAMIGASRRVPLGAWAVLLVGAASLVGSLAPAGPALAATAEQKQAVVIWKQQDRCARAAFAHDPDYTPVAIRRRNAAIRACDIAHGVPPRTARGASPVRRIPDANRE